MVPAHHTFGRIRVSRYHKLLLLIIALVVGAAVVVWKLPMHQGLDLAGGIRVVLEADNKDLPAKVTERADKMSAVRKVITNRVEGTLGVAEPKVQLQGTNRIVVELPGYKDKDQALNTIKSTDRLEFYWLRDVKTEKNPAGKWEMMKDEDKNGNEIYSFVNSATNEVLKGDTPEGREQIMKQVVRAEKYVPDGVKPVLTGDQLKAESKGAISQGKPVMLIHFTPEGTAVFRDFTRRHVGDILAIFLGDNLQTAPNINEPIMQGDAEVSGFKNLTEAQNQSNFLNAGALPVPLKIVELSTVEATLGHETVSQALMAGLIGLSLVALFMLLYYRLPGFLADVALCIYALLTFAVFTAFKVTMTLPGLAGFILSIGMAVDANILIFERMKEELRSGKTLRAAIDAGFARAFSAIFDSNMCTIITSLILMWFGTGSVKSFAFTLAIGVVVSMFTAITVTRTFLHLLVSLPWVQKPSLFGLSTSWIHQQGTNGKRGLDIVGKRNYYFIFSGILLVIGLVFIGMHGLNKGIEFRSGTSIQATFKQPVTVTDVNSLLAPLGVKSDVQISDKRTAFIRTDLDPEKNSNKITAIQNTLKDKVEPGRTQISSVGPIVSAELMQKATMAVILASIAIIIYLSFRFAVGGFANGIKYGISAVAALIHDVVITIGLFALGGKLWGWEVDTLFVTALLTIIGFSVHDTIVVFDRIRENVRHRLKGEDGEALANRSILETLSRSINTSLTVMMTLASLVIFGGPIIQRFYIALLFGICIGTYSSIFNATPILVVWEKVAAAKKSGGQRKAAQDKPMVSLKAADKPLVNVVSGNGSSVEDAVSDEADKVKVKPKKKKKRY